MTRSQRGPGFHERRVAILTGARGSGKTTACRRLVARARGLGLTCAGIVSPGRFDGRAKVGIDVVDVRTGERRSLAEVDELPAELRVGPHRFDEAAIAWGRDRLDAACPCDIVIVDEIGPLELERGGGWVNAMHVLRFGEYRLAVVVVRPRLVQAVRMAAGALPGTTVVERPIVAGGGAVSELLSLVVDEHGHVRLPAE